MRQNFKRSGFLLGALSGLAVDPADAHLFGPDGVAFARVNP